MLAQSQPITSLVKPPPLTVNGIEALEELYYPHRYKVAKGGRGGGKSREFSQAAVLAAYQGFQRVLCVREFQNSISDSVHRLLSDQIKRLNLGLWFEVGQNFIRNTSNGSEFLFKGMRQNADEVKSTEGVTIAWYEEAQKASANSLKILFPTIRADNSEIWFSYNPVDEDDPVDDIFVKNPPPNAWVRHINWDENPYFPDVLNQERLHMLNTDPVAYEHVWGGGYLKISEAVIFGKRVEVRAFETPLNARFYYGADFGFANDPSALIRLFIENDTLYIDYEAFGYGVEIDELPQLYNTIPGVRNWPIKGDCSRPETISYLARKGFRIKAAEKWPGSVEDGIAHLKGFSKIVIHDRCPRMAQEARLYSYKVDKVTGDVLPIIVDKHNHGWDAVRYALDQYIQKRGNLAVWDKL